MDSGESRSENNSATIKGKKKKGEAADFHNDALCFSPLSTRLSHF